MTGKLAVIDMQRVFGADGSPWQSPGFAAILDPIARLVEAYGDNTIFTRYVAPQPPHGAWLSYFQDWPFALQPPEAELWQMTPTLAAAADRQEAQGIGPIVLPTFSKWGPELADFAGPDGRLILTGVSTDCCVLSTALAAADSGVEVWVVSDATAGIDDATEDKALYLMSLYGPLIKIVTTAEAIAAAGATPGSADSRQET
jgi:nicotinamidase-related amidase